MTVRYAGLASVYLLGLLGRGLYEWLKERHRVDPTRRLVFAIVFADMALMWAAWFGMSELDPMRMGLSPMVRWGGLALSILGLLLFLGALFQLRALENTKVLVSNGLFALTRHPIYLGFVFWLVGWPLFQDAGVSLCLAAPGIASIFHWRRNEERALRIQFGAAYRDYEQRTWF